ALAGLAVDYLIMAFAGALWLLFLGRVLAGVAGSTWAVANAYVADIADEESRAKSFGIVSAAGAAGLILGPAIGGLLGAVDVRTPFYAAAALTAANVVYGYFVLPETLTPENRRPFEWRRANPLGGLAHVRRYPLIVGILSAFFLMHMANQSLAHIWAFYVKEKFDWNTLQTGVSITFYAITVAVAQGALTGPVVKRFGERRAILFGLISGFCGFVMLATAGVGWLLYVAMIIGACAGFVTPSMQSLMTRAAPANAQGELQGAITSTLAITVITGPLLMTQLFSAFTDDVGVYFAGAPFFLSALIFVATAVLFFSVAGRRHGKPANEDQPQSGAGCATGPVDDAGVENAAALRGRAR
ncbi:MAG: MFS transporter, partial [Pseudomonadota bacterium]